MAAGYSQKCAQSYTSVRKIGLDNELRKKLEVEKLCIKSVDRLVWEAQQLKIRHWIRVAKICFPLLFATERSLSEQIFKGLGADDIDDACFLDTVKDYATLSLNFVEVICTGRKSPQKLFTILNLYQVFADLLPEIETIFGSKSGEFIRKQAVEILSSLSERARGILSEFEETVLGEISKAPFPGGSVHPMTRYVMNYISSMVEYRKALIKLIVCKPSTHSVEMDFGFTEFEREASPLVLHLVWITKILKFNLEDKSKRYEDAALAHFFMMNNVHYIVGKIKGSITLTEMIGDDCLNKLTSEHNAAATKYLNSSWKIVIDSLRYDDLRKLPRFLSVVSRLVLRNRLKAFNAKFKEMHTTQATWLVSDDVLREELRISMSQLIIPVYTSFLERYTSHIQVGKHPENYIIYSVEDLEKAIIGMFKEDM